MPQSWSYVVTIGASAGGLKAISSLISALPGNFAAPVVVAIHAKEIHSLPEILARRTPMRTELIQDEALLRESRVYVCPGGKQSYFLDGRVIVTNEALGERFTPSINILFESMAREYGEHALAVVMSGMLNDGTQGALTLTRHGSSIFVQAPEEAEHGSMPNNVILNDEPLEILPAVQIAEALVRIVGTTDDG